MKTIIMDRHGGPEALRYGDLPDPVSIEQRPHPRTETTRLLILPR